MTKEVNYFYGLCGNRKFGEQLKETMAKEYGTQFNKLCFMKVKTKSKIGKIIKKAIKLWVKSEDKQ